MSSSQRIGEWFITTDERDCGGVTCHSVRLDHVKNEAAVLEAIELPCHTEWRVFIGGKLFKVAANQLEKIIKNHTGMRFSNVTKSLALSADTLWVVK